MHTLTGTHTAPDTITNDRRHQAVRLAWRLVVAAATVLFLWAWASRAAAAVQETFDHTYPLAAGGRVSLDNVNGDVHIDVWERAEVRVHAVKQADTQKGLDELRIEVDASPAAVRIDTRYPDWSAGLLGRHEDTSVAYTVTVPADARLDRVELVNGDLEVVGVTGGVRAETVNGHARLAKGAGSVRLETVNGGIEVSLERVGKGDDVHLESVNGGVELALPASASARVQAESVNGSIGNDFDLAVEREQFGPGRSMRGTIGGGEGEVSLETVNGRIRVNRR